MAAGRETTGLAKADSQARVETIRVQPLEVDTDASSSYVQMVVSGP